MGLSQYQPGEYLRLLLRLTVLRCPVFSSALLAFILVLTPGGAFRAYGITPEEADAQEHLRQQERERLLRQQLEQTPDVRLQSSPGPDGANRLPSNESPCFRIERIALTGDSAEQFQWALEFADQTEDGTPDPARQRCLGTRGVNLVMRRIQNAIVASGFVTTRILAGPQDLSTGALQLTIVPGRIHSIRFTADADTRATQWNATPAHPGDLLNLRDIEQALENFKRVPTVEADIQVTPAEGENVGPGESDLVIAWKQRFPLRLTLSADNSGAKSTGKIQGGATLSWDHCLTLNDLLYVNSIHNLANVDGNGRSKGNTVHYSLPFGYWMVSATTSRNEYRQSVAGAFQPYLYSGTSNNSTIRISRLVYRDSMRKTTLSLGGWERGSKFFIEDTELEVQRRQMAGWEAEVNHRENIGSATLDLNLNYRRGTGARDSLPAPEELFNEGSSRPKIILADAKLSQPFTLGSQKFRYAANARTQWNETPLVPQDRFSVGGRYTARGFDGENTLSAERGWLFRNDLGWMLWDSGQEFYLGLDYGQVAGASSDKLVGKELAGGGIGLRGDFMNGSYDLFVGEPLMKPDGFETADLVAYFLLNWSF